MIRYCTILRLLSFWHAYISGLTPHFPSCLHGMQECKSWNWIPARFTSALHSSKRYFTMSTRRWNTAWMRAVISISSNWLTMVGKLFNSSCTAGRFPSLAALTNRSIAYHFVLYYFEGASMQGFAHVMFQLLPESRDLRLCKLQTHYYTF